MKFYLSSILFGLSLSVAQAQSKPLSLTEALDLGLKNRLEIKQQAVQIQIAEQENAKIKAQWLPQVTANADLRVNTQLQKSVIPVGAFGLPNVASAATQVVAFGVPFQNAVGLDITQKIYDKNRGIDTKINANNLESQQNTLEQRKIDIRYAITEGYFGALFQKEKVKLAAQTVERAKVNLENGEQRFKVGTIVQNDLDRLRLDLSNAQLNEKKAQKDFELALENLAYQMQTPLSMETLLTDNLESFFKNETALPTDKAESRPEIRAERIAQQLNVLNQEKALARNAPSVSAYGNYSILALNENISPFSYLGVRVAVPIYDGKQAKIAANEYKLREQINQTNIEKLKADFAYDAKSALKALEQAQIDVVESQKNIALARQIVETDQFRLQKGSIVENDLKASELSLQTAENNYLSAVYNFLVAQLKYKKATGNL